MEEIISDEQSNDDLSLIDSEDEVEWRKDISAIKEFKAGFNETLISEPTDIQDPSILNVILSCSELTSNVDNILIINRAMIYLLRTMKSQILTRLRSNVNKQDHLYDKLKKENSKSNDFISNATGLKCGMPYFKLPNGWPQPKNMYWEQHKKLGYSCPEIFFKSCYCWTEKENNELKKLVIACVRETKLVELETKVRQLNRYVGVDKVLAETSKQADKLKRGYGIKVDVDDVDWLRVSKNLGSVFSPSECQIQWTYWVDPEINSSKWTSEEQNKLCALVQEHGFQSWDKISRLLNTGRNALKCCMVFHQNIARNCVANIDKNKFVMLFNCYKDKPRHIVKISFFADCTLNECQKLLNTLKLKIKPKTTVYLPKIYKHDLKSAFEQTSIKRRCWLAQKHKQLKDSCTFTSEEDYLLLEAVSNHNKDWSIVCEAVPGRNRTQVKERYGQLLNFSKSVLAALTMSEARVPLDLLPSRSNAGPGISIWSILQLFWEPTDNIMVNSIFGIPLTNNISTSTQQILKIFEFGHTNLFGPRFALPRSDDQKRKMVMTLSVISKALNLDFVPKTVVERLKTHATSDLDETIGYPENTMLQLEDVDPPAVSHFIFRSLVPPNLLTLLGTRVMSSVRGLLYSQAELPLPMAFTRMNPSIDVGDRLRGAEAKERLKSRIFSMFFLSISLAKIAKFPGQYKPPQKSSPKKTKMSKLQKKRNASKISAKRWKKKIVVSSTSKEKNSVKKRSNTPPPPEPTKKAKMVRVTKVGCKSVVVPISEADLEQ